MKAEHRKDLETNILADRMGQTYQRIRTPPDRRGIIYVVVALLVAGVGLLTYRHYNNRKADNSEEWMQLEDGAFRYIKNLVQTAPDTNAGKAARLQAAWIQLWEDGLKNLAQRDPRDPRKQPPALDVLDQMTERYRRLREDVTGDPVFEPEAKYALAVIEETNAIRNLSRLDSAKSMYQEIVDQHKDSAHAVLAKERVEALTDPAKRSEIALLYHKLHIVLGIQENPGAQKGMGLKGEPKRPAQK